MRRTATVKVISNKGEKTITVLVERRVQHPIYGKIIKRSSKLMAHDEQNQCNEGDLVNIENAVRCPSGKLDFGKCSRTGQQGLTDRCCGCL